MIEQKYIDRFHTKYIKKDSGCWEWQEGKHNGYGQYRVGKTVWRAHRFSALINGISLGDDLIRHTCNNPSCVCPDHLMSGSYKDNSDDKVTAQRQPRGTTHGRSKLTEQQVKDIRDKYVPWVYSTTKLAKEYGVSHVMINAIVNKKNWNHI